MLVAFASLYLLWPSLTGLHLLAIALRDGARLDFAAALLVEAASFVCIWELSASRCWTKSWYMVRTSQLAGNALSRVIPGGMAASGAPVPDAHPCGPAERAHRLRARLGLRAHLRHRARAPALSLPAIIGGTPWPGPRAGRVPRRRPLRPRADRRHPRVRLGPPLRVVGRAATWVLNRTIRRKHHVDGLAERLLHEQDSLRVAFGARWKRAVVAAGGRWILEYLALVACLWAVGAGQPLAGAPRLRRRGLPGDDPADPGRPGLRRGGPDGPPRPRRRLSRRRRRRPWPTGSSRSGSRSRPAAPTCSSGTGIRERERASHEEHVHLDGRRELRRRTLELPGRGAEERRRRAALRRQRVVRPPVDRDRGARAKDGERLRGAARVEVAWADRRPPAPDREERDVEAVGSSAMPGKRSVSPAK